MVNKAQTDSSYVISYNIARHKTFNSKLEEKSSKNKKGSQNYTHRSVFT